MEKEKITFKHILLTIKTWTSLLIILVIISLITLPVLLVTILFDKKRKLYLVLTRFFVRLFFILNFCSIKKRIDLKGLTKPASGEKRIYVINHASLIDGLLLFLLPGDIKFMAKESYAKIPVFGLGISMTGNITVKKGNDGEQLDILMHGEEIVENGYPLAIFPEGTRSKNGNIGRFANGTFLIALNTHADIVPVVFETWNTLRPGSFIVRDNDFYVEVLDTLKYDEFKDLKYKEIGDKIKKLMINKILDIRDKKRKKSKKYYRNKHDYIELDEIMRKQLM
jgi:1-acyl-sn-glycerol-3-phosphate acyltransferase